MKDVTFYLKNRHTGEREKHFNNAKRPADSEALKPTQLVEKKRLKIVLIRVEDA